MLPEVRIFVFRSEVSHVFFSTDVWRSWRCPDVSITTFACQLVIYVHSFAVSFSIAHAYCIVANPPASSGRLPHLALVSRTFPHNEISPEISRILPHSNILPQKFKFIGFTGIFLHFLSFTPYHQPENWRCPFVSVCARACVCVCVCVCVSVCLYGSLCVTLCSCLYVSALRNNFTSVFVYVLMCDQWGEEVKVIRTERCLSRSTHVVKLFISVMALILFSVSLCIFICSQAQFYQNIPLISWKSLGIFFFLYKKFLRFWR